MSLWPFKKREKFVFHPSVKLERGIQDTQEISLLASLSFWEEGSHCSKACISSLPWLPAQKSRQLALPMQIYPPPARKKCIFCNLSSFPSRAFIVVKPFLCQWWRSIDKKGDYLVRCIQHLTFYCSERGIIICTKLCQETATFQLNHLNVSDTHQAFIIEANAFKKRFPFCSLRNTVLRNKLLKK